MAVSKEYRDYVVEQLGRVMPVRAKAMFGGYGIYADEVFFALLSSNETLYLKVDDTNRADFERIGMGAFQPYSEGKAMPYYELPADILEDTDALRPWLEKALAVARRSPKKKGK